MKLSANLQGILWMVFGMVGFALLDSLLKLLAGAIPTGQILIYQGIGGAAIFALMGIRAGLSDWRARFFHPVILARNLCEVLAAAGFVTALATASLSAVAAIIQSNPLLVTLGAAIWLKEKVGPRRWAAILVGLFGVLLVIRPGTDVFEPASLYAVGGVIFLTGRDLLTRWVPKEIPTVQIGTFAMFSLILAGLFLQLVTAAPVRMPDTWQTLFVIGTILMLPIGVYGTTAAMRVGDISVVTPFRYSRLVFVMVLAALLFDERPDAWTYLGAAIIVASGLYSLWREQIRRKS